MFTGIIQGTAKIVSLEEKSDFRIHTIELPEYLLQDLEIGSSVANDGCCLTVSNISGSYVSFNLIKETLNVTNMLNLSVGNFVNIERAARFGDEIGGHLMSGHIMTTAEIREIVALEHNFQMWFKLRDPHIIKYIFYKGFIGIDGISLTVGTIKNSCFCVHLIPDTIKRTTIGTKKLHQIVNIEIDHQTHAIVNTVEHIITSKKYDSRF